MDTAQLRTHAQTVARDSLREAERGLLLTLMDALPSVAAEQVLRLVVEAYEHGVHNGIQGETATWEKVAAHFGMADALAVVYQHVQAGMLTPCQAHTIEQPCTLPPAPVFSRVG